MGLEIGQSLVENDMLGSPKGYRTTPSRAASNFICRWTVVAASREPGAETKIVPVQEIQRAGTGWISDRLPVKLFSEAVRTPRPFSGTARWACLRWMLCTGTLAMAHSVANAYALTIVGGGETAQPFTARGI